MKSLHLFSRNTSAKGKKGAWEQHSLRNAHGKMALNSDANVRSGRLGAERQSSPRCYTFTAPELSPADSRTTAEQAKVEGEQKDKKEGRVFLLLTLRAPESFCKDFGQNTAPPEKATAGDTGPSAALPEAAGSPGAFVPPSSPSADRAGRLIGSQKQQRESGSCCRKRRASCS